MSHRPRRVGKWPVALAFFLWHCDSERLTGGECSTAQDCNSGEVCVSGRCQKPSAVGCSGDEDCDLSERCDLNLSQCVPISVVPDSGVHDSGVVQDLGFEADATPTDAIVTDTGEVDSGVVDTGAFDTGVADTGVLDAGIGDSGVVDTGIIDTGIVDTGVVDTGIVDTGVVDVGFPDSGLPPPCNLDADCNNANLICVATVCTLRCDAPGAAACPGTEVCNATTGRCAPGNLPLGGDCAFDAQCSTGLCLGLTIGATSYSICTSACGAGSHCPLNFSCSEVSGMNFCLGENLSTPPGTYDTIAGGFCSSTVNTCQSGWCNTGGNQCIETCSRDADCAAFGGQCWTFTQGSGATTTYDHLCFAAGGTTVTGGLCALNDSCESGVCDRYEGTCAAHCCSDSDCPGAQTCAEYDLDATHTVKICIPRTPTAGTGALGSTCTSYTQCESEVCVPTDFNDTASVRRCSTLCCRDADCAAALPLGGRCVPAGGALANTIVGVCQPN